jgi:hypothetical protein
MRQRNVKGVKQAKRIFQVEGKRKPKRRRKANEENLSYF